MKKFHEYITESARIHDYRIRIVGDVPAEFSQRFRDQLKRFDPVELGELKTTPVLSSIPDFPAYANERVNIMDVSFRYPATDPQIRQMAQLLGLDTDRICITQRDYAEGMDQELLGIEQQKDLLTNTDYPKDTPQQRDLKRDYAAVGIDKAVVKNSAEDAVWTVAGGKTKPAETTNDLPQGVRSPMTAVKRPPRPAVGFKTQGR
jgi:hypothetical protein